MLRLLTRLSLACMVALSLSGLAVAHERDDHGPRGAVQYGYHNGYLDGFQHGREDSGARVGYEFESRDYDSAMRGYESYMGSEEQYRNGYREGYATGYDDGYYGRDTRFGDRSSELPYNGEAYGYGQRPAEGPHSVAFQVGYKDGLIEGGKDRRHNKNFQPEKHDRYKDGDQGYTHDYGSKKDYKREFREGYMAGYQRGYGDLEGGWNR
jgi:hypothetical protein